MTLVKVKEEIFLGKNIVTQIEIENHADFDIAGNDIVCAAVTSATELVINVLTENFACKCDIKVVDEPPNILIDISKKEFSSERRSLAVGGLLNGFVSHLKNIAEDYPKNVKVVCY